MEKCVFCEIAAGRLPASIVYEDNMVLAIMDLHPVNPGHVMVIPRRHFETLNDMDETTGMHLFQIAMRVEQALRNVEGIRCEGTNLLQNNGRVAGQDVFHSHLHIIPRFAGDAMRMSFGACPAAERTALDALADAIEDAM
jgi:histidine triad (HIT) family protein